MPTALAERHLKRKADAVTPVVEVIDCGTCDNDCGPLTFLRALTGEDLRTHTDVGILTGLLRIIAGLVLGCPSLDLASFGAGISDEVGDVSAVTNDLGAERSIITSRPNGYGSFVPDTFFMALARVWGFGVLVHDATRDGWDRYDPPASPVAPLKSLPAWLGMVQINQDHWCYVKPSEPDGKWSNLAHDFELEKEKILDLPSAS